MQWVKKRAINYETIYPILSQQIINYTIVIDFIKMQFKEYANLNFLQLRWSQINVSSNSIDFDAAFDHEKIH